MSGSLLNKIKKGVASSGNSKGKVLFVAADTKRRIRFLQEIEDGIELTLHDDFEAGVKAICQKHLGKTCPYCEREGMRTRNAYFFSVYDHDDKEVKLFEGYANNFNPLPALVAMYESYGTLTDRDYVIQREGKGKNTRYSVVPMDKVKFKNNKAKPYTKKKALEILNKAYPVDEEDIIDDDDEDINDDVEENDGEDWEDEDENENDYEEMSAPELYRECISRGLKVKKKMKKKYYITKLEEDDAKDNDDDWEDDEDDDGDEW